MNRSTQAAKRRPRGEVPRISPWILASFVGYARRYLRLHFHAIRILKSGLPPPCSERPLVIYLNHAAWWDPLVCLLLAREFFPERPSYAPIDAAMLERYGFFKRLGFFGVDSQRPEGGLQFMRTALTILASTDKEERAPILWITPQGRFADVRERPLRFQDGLGALAARESNAAFVPLAIEYSFWTEPRPEVLVSFGKETDSGHATNAAQWSSSLSDALEEVQDHLAHHSCRREVSDWLVLDRGRSGVSAVYDCWRSLKARLRGERFAAEHQPENTP